MNGSDKRMSGMGTALAVQMARAGGGVVLARPQYQLKSGNTGATGAVMHGSGLGVVQSGRQAKSGVASSDADGLGWRPATDRSEARYSE